MAVVGADETSESRRHDVPRATTLMLGESPARDARWHGVSAPRIGAL